MILLLHEDLANLFRHRLFPKRFTLPDAIAVIADGLVLVIEIIPELSYHQPQICRRLAGRYAAASTLAVKS